MPTPTPLHCIPEATPAQLASTPICEMTCADGSYPVVRLVPEAPAGIGLVVGMLALAALVRC